MFKKILVASLVLSLTLAAGAQAGDWGRGRDHGRDGWDRGGRERSHHHHGGGDGLALALGLGLGAVILSEALRPDPDYVAPAPGYVRSGYANAYAPPPPAPLVAIAGTRRDYGGYVTYQARDAYGSVFECRQYDNGYRTCN
jgi:hypothetical protein